MGQPLHGSRCALAVRCVESVADTARRKDRPRDASHASRGEPLCSLSRGGEFPHRRRSPHHPGTVLTTLQEGGPMFAVIFEVQPRRERWDDYLNLAKLLKPELEKIEGFIDNERFASKRTKGRLLSLSTWRDEKAVIRWRTHGIHHGAQEKGRFDIFEDYHLRVGEITADTQIPKGGTLQEQRFDETETGTGKAVTISELSPTKDGKPASADLAADLDLP